MEVYQLDESRGKFEVRHTIILFFNTAEIPINDEVLFCQLSWQNN